MRLAILAALAAATPALAGEDMTVEVTPEGGGRYTIACDYDGAPAIEHESDAPRTYSFADGPIECTVHTFGPGGISVIAENGRGSRTRLINHGSGGVLRFTLR